MILSISVLAAMAFVGGCENTFFDPPAEITAVEAPAKEDAVAREAPTRKGPVVVIETSMGRVTAELWADKAPITVKNFLAYVDDKHFDGLIFHRVMQGFMIQGGGFNPDMSKKPVGDSIKNEAGFDKKNDRGTLAMARTPIVDSATSQFYINLVDNDGLNHSDRSFSGFGYCAFGKVTDGMDVVDKIGSVPVGVVAGRPNVPLKPVLIKSVRRADGQ